MLAVSIPLRYGGIWTSSAARFAVEARPDGAAVRQYWRPSLDALTHAAPGRCHSLADSASSDLLDAPYYYGSFILLKMRHAN